MDPLRKELETIQKKIEKNFSDFSDGEKTMLEYDKEQDVLYAEKRRVRCLIYNK